MARPSDPDENDDKHLKPHPDHPIADKPGPGRPHPEQPIAEPPVAGLQIIKAKAQPKQGKEGEPMTRVYLTGDHRNVVTEAYIPTADFGFRIFVEGQHYEQVGEHADSGTRIYGPTR